MLKYILMSVAAAVIIGIAWPLATAAFSDKPTEAANLVEATNRTNNKAESLNNSFTDVIPPAPPPQAAIPRARRLPEDSLFTSSPLDPSPAEAAQGHVPGQEPVPGQPQDNSGGVQQPPPTPDKYAVYEHPSEHAVRDAIEYLNRLQTELDPTQTQYIQAIEQLQRAWQPRYQRAVEEYKRFAYRIDHADAMAQEYFEVQQKLTVQITSQDDRRAAEERDLSESNVYLDWRDQAFRTLGQAQLIMYDLHDMNIIITKQRLSAHFAALYEDFQEIPPAISLLHEELARFRTESDRIQQTFGVPAN